MIKRLLLLLSIICLSYAQEPKLVETMQIITLKGNIGKSPISMFLFITENKPDSSPNTSISLSGHYYYDKIKSPIYIYGKKYQHDNDFEIESDGKNKEYFTFTPSDEIISYIKNPSTLKSVDIKGTWKKGNKTLPLTINAIGDLGSSKDSGGIGKIEVYEFSTSLKTLKTLYDDNDEVSGSELVPLDYTQTALYLTGKNLAVFIDKDNLNIDLLNEHITPTIKQMPKDEFLKALKSTSDVVMDSDMELADYYVSINISSSYGSLKGLLFDDNILNFTISYNEFYAINLKTLTQEKSNVSLLTLGDIVTMNENCITTKKGNPCYVIQKEFDRYMANIGDSLGDIGDYIAPYNTISVRDDSISIFFGFPRVVQCYDDFSIELNKLKPYLRKDSQYSYMWE